MTVLCVAADWDRWGLEPWHKMTVWGLFDEGLPAYLKVLKLGPKHRISLQWCSTSLICVHSAVLDVQSWQFAPSADIHRFITMYDTNGSFGFEDAPGTWQREDKSQESEEELAGPWSRLNVITHIRLSSLTTGLSYVILTHINLRPRVWHEAESSVGYCCKLGCDADDH